MVYRKLLQETPIGDTYRRHLQKTPIEDTYRRRLQKRSIALLPLGIVLEKLNQTIIENFNKEPEPLVEIPFALGETILYQTHTPGILTTILRYRKNRQKSSSEVYRRHLQKTPIGDTLEETPIGDTLEEVYRPLTTCHNFGKMRHLQKTPIGGTYRRLIIISIKYFKGFNIKRI